MELCVLDDIESIKESRKNVIELYKKELSSLVVFKEQNEKASQNYSYMPVVFKSEDELLGVQKALNERDIS